MDGPPRTRHRQQQLRVTVSNRPTTLRVRLPMLPDVGARAGLLQAFPQPLHKCILVVVIISGRA